MRTLIIGLGTTLAQDDGVGIYIANRLKSNLISKDVDILILGTDILRLMNQFENQERVIIIDAMNANLDSGSVICLKEKGLFSFNGLSRSVHQISMLEGLKLLKLTQPEFEKCEIFFIGIQIKDTRLNTNISDEVIMSAEKITEILANFKFS